MAHDFQRLIEELRRRWPDVRGEVRPEWGERAARSQIRQSLRSLDDSSEVTDLSHPPRSKNWSMSVSHASNLGGWLALPRPARIGFDIEAKSRIKRSLVERVSRPEELELAPELELLWGAKESYFKALEHEQPATITQLVIPHWKKISHGLFEWSDDRAMGVVTLDDKGWIFAATVIGKAETKAPK